MVANEGRWEALNPCPNGFHYIKNDEFCTYCGWAEKDINEFEQRDVQDYKSSSEG